MSSSSEIDVLAPFENTLKRKRKKRKKVQLSLYQTRHKGIQGPRKKRKVQRQRKKPTITFHSVDSTVFNDSESTVGYSDTENFLELNVTTTTLDGPEDCWQADQSFRMSYAVSPEHHMPNLQNNNQQNSAGLDTHDNDDSYMQRCLRKLQSGNLMRNVLDKFHDENLLRHFMKFLEGIADGTLEVTNMSVLTCMERAFLQSLRNTVGMRYRQDTYMFWEAVLSVGGPRLLRLFSSDKHFAQVVSDVSEKSKYNPSEGDFNFAVPDERMLRKSRTNIPSVVPCGIIEESFDMFNYEKEYVLSLDGKICVQGLRHHGEGDINLWGYEGPPTLAESIETLQIQLGTIHNVRDGVLTHTNRLGREVDDLKLILKITSERIKGLREGMVRHEILRASYMKKIAKFPGQSSKYTLAFSEVDAFIAKANDVIKELLKVNLEWCRIMSMIQQTEHCFKGDGPICLDDQDNGWILRDPDVIGDEDFLQERPEFIKQRSDMWLAMRQESRITGSTMNNALGFRTLKDQTNHFNSFILKKERPPVSEYMQRCMDHGTAHEMNAVGTLLATLMPAFLPRCHRFVEAGCFFIPSQSNMPRFMEVSPDGLIECVHDCVRCDNRIGVPVGEIAVEIKSPYSGIDNPRVLPVHYEPPTYYVCQLLAELFATKRRHLWYISSSPQSTTLSFIDFDDSTWNKLWSLAVELYGDTEPLRQLSLHGNSIEYRNVLKEFIPENSLFAAEVPTLKCVDDARYSTVPLDDKEMFRYRHEYPDVTFEDLDHEQISNAIVEACDTSIRLIQEAYGLQRRKATEILMFVATDTDREFNKDKPMSIPVAYALKGRSIRVDTARKMVNDVRRKCKDKGLTILVEAYDGQWSQLVFRSMQDQPLTLFEFGRDCWIPHSNMAKDKILSTINSFSLVTQENLDEWSRMRFLDVGEFTIGNIEVTISKYVEGPTARKVLSLSSCSGPLNIKGILFLLYTPSCKQRPQLWNLILRNKANLLEILSTKSSAALHAEGLQDVMTQTEDWLMADDVADRSQDAMQLDEDLRHVPGTIGITHQDNEVDVEVPSSEGVSQGIQTSPPTDNELPPSLDQHHQSAAAVLSEADHIKNYLMTEHKCMLESILITFLSSNRSSKWEHFSLEEFYDTVFSSRHAIYAQLNATEMNVIASHIMKHQGNVVPFEYKQSDNKVKKANELGFVFGLHDVLTPAPMKVTMRRLRELAIIKLQRHVPVSVLRVALATWKFRIGLHDWLDSSTMPISYEIPVEPYEFDLFSYPEKNVELGCLQPRVIDPSHCLTNLRLHALQKGFFGCKRAAFVRVSEADNKLLSRGLVELPLLDKQSVPFAQKVFSYEVEQAMLQNADFREAELVRHVRRWFNACNERGLSVSTRIKYLVDMHNYMMKHYNPGRFPMNTSYVDGLPAPTFQAVMQNISVRIQLYALAKLRKFSHRTISTLPVESMFADLNTLAKGTGGCPLALQIPRYIAKMTQFNAMKNDPTKPFSMRLTKKTNYPPMPADILPDVVMTNMQGEAIYRTHNFDKPEQRVRRKKYRRDFISFGNAPLRGMLPLRPLFYKVNEATIPAMTRLGFKK